MATALYATMLVHPSRVEEIKAYLYDHTEIVEFANVVREDDGPALTILILRTEADTEERTRYVQQYQCDRLASGMHGMTIGYETRFAAHRAAEGIAYRNDWGLSRTYPASALVPEHPKV